MDRLGATKDLIEFVKSTGDTMRFENLEIATEDAHIMTLRLAREEGLLVGISAGANTCAAVQIARALGPGNTVVTVFCDTGERYLTTEVFQAEGI